MNKRIKKKLAKRNGYRTYRKYRWHLVVDDLNALILQIPPTELPMYTMPYRQQAAHDLHEWVLNNPTKSS